MIKILGKYAKLMRLHKPIGIFLLLWPNLWALWLGSAGLPPLNIMAIFVAGVFIMRPAGCIINDVADRHFDGKVARTKDRPLATGEITTKAALVLFCLLSLCGLILVLQLNLQVILIAMLALILGIIYPFTKRVMYFPQLVLGVGWYLGVPMAFAALHKINAICWILYLSAILWTIIYDTMYAMVDREDDLLLGIKSTAVYFADKECLFIGILQVLVLLLWVLVGTMAQLNFYYFIAVMMAAILFLYQQALILTRQPDKCLRAFLNNNWLGMMIFLGIVLGLQ